MVVVPILRTIATRIAPRIASRFAPAARSSINRIAPSARTLGQRALDIGKSVLKRTSVQAALGITAARGIAESVASGNIRALRPTAVETGLIAGSPFGFFSAAGGALLGGYKGEVRKAFDIGKEAATTGYDVFQEARRANEQGFTSADPTIAAVQGLLNAEFDRPSGLSLPDINYPSIEYPDISYPEFSPSFSPSVTITPPDITVPVQAGVGLDTTNIAALAALLGVPIAYLLGRRAPKRKKYKRKKRRK